MAMRKRLIAGNWKMYKTRAQAQAFAEELAAAWPPATGHTVEALPEAVVCAPFTALAGLLTHLSKAGVKLGAQNVHAQTDGAFTGEVAAAMLQEVGCSYVIVGHSERRMYQQETSEAVAKKAQAALAAGITPIVCVGESLQERETGRTQAVIGEQLAPVLQVLQTLDAQGSGTTQGASAAATVIAYEPIWAIGTGKSSSAVDAQLVIGFIRSLLSAHLGAATAGAVRILYGGSVKPDNIAAYLAQADIDGALVGGASLHAASYAELLKQSMQA